VFPSKSGDGFFGQDYVPTKIDEDADAARLHWWSFDANIRLPRRGGKCWHRTTNF
jgi:hypothetical protein